MLITLANVLYVLIAVAMIGFILVQRGPGADAGSGFGGGASATVFGARGSANFLSKSTAVLATLFFLLSLGMAIYERHSSQPTQAGQDLGVMAGVGVTTVDDADAKAPVVLPEAGKGSEVPAAPAASDASGSEVPVAAPAQPPVAAPAAQGDAPAKDAKPSGDAG